jgi:hypothetical protein
VDTLRWLLESDPAIAWQAMRDLTYESPSEVAAWRTRVPHEGLAARVLAIQQPDGSWHRPNTPVWASTLFTLLLLRSTGVNHEDPRVQAAIERLENSLCWNDVGGWNLRPIAQGGNPFFEGEVEPCINGGVLAIGAFFGRPNEKLAHRLLSEQLPDGGWNCDAPPSTRSSFHTTICVLEGLLEYEHALQAGVAPSREIAGARKRAEEYLLERSLFRRFSTGEVVDPSFLELAFPPRYRYDILRALDYLRSAGAGPDPRVAEAVHLVESKKEPDGIWLLDRCWEEVLPVTIDEETSGPSRWNTLRALRVLRWYEQGSAVR